MNQKQIEQWSNYWRAKKEALADIAENYHIEIAGDTRMLVDNSGRAAPLVVNKLWFDATLLCKFLDRPKRVARIATMNCEALAHTEIRVPFDCYRQPFPTMIVELPPEFGRNHEFDCQHLPFDGQFGGGRLARPSFVVLDYNERPRHLIIMVVYENGHSFTTQLVEPSSMLEDSLNRIEQSPVLDNLPPPSSEEYRIQRKIHRIALNIMLLMTNYGYDRLANNRDSLKKRLRFSRKPLEQRQLEIKLKEMPFVYEIRQTVKIYRTQLAQEGEERGEGSAKRPHWRRGHWRRQAIGEQWKEHRLTFIAPMLIHAERFAGSPDMVTAEYQYKGES